MKNKLLILMLCGLTICGGCGKSSDESDSIDVEISAGQSDSQSASDESDNATSNENTSDDDTSSSDDESKSDLAKSPVDDEDVKKAQEEYMKNIHSVKGKSVVERLQNENFVMYQETVPAEEEGETYTYYYEFYYSKSRYEDALKTAQESETSILIENNDAALYIKTRNVDTLSYPFESYEKMILEDKEDDGGFVYVE